jgi:predicted amidohydrolase YtcJ
MHPFHGTDGTRGADLGGLRTLDEVRGALAAERARCAPGEWVLGWGLSYDAFHGERIAAEAIEPAVGDAPAFLSFFDYHSGLASRPALALAGVDGPARVPAGAAVVCDERGLPTGELRERRRWRS